MNELIDKVRVLVEHRRSGCSLVALPMRWIAAGSGADIDDAYFT